MTQDQDSQPSGPGYVAGSDAAPESEAEEYGTEQAKPKTRFQKVASALLGDRPDRDEADQEQVPEEGQGRPPQDRAAGSQVITSSQAATGSDAMAPASGPAGATPTWTPAGNAGEAAAVSSPAGTAPASSPAGTAPAAGGSTPPRDYWDEPQEPAAARDEAVAVTNPDVPVPDTDADMLPLQDQAAGPPGADAAEHAATQPDVYGTAHAGSGAATIADAPVAGATAAGTAPVPAAATAPGPAAATAPGPAAATAPGPAAATAPGPAAGGSRPGALGDFSDLTYGNLIPDADQFIAQWQQIQFRFVDDPHGSVTEAADVVAQVTAKLEAAIQERQRAIEERQRAIAEQQRVLRGRWGEGTNADTEVLRETLRMYHTFLEQLIGSRTS